MASELTLTL